MKTQLKKVLITGANGFTGRYMTMEMIDAGYDVYCAGHAIVTTDKNYNVDLCDKKSIKTIIDIVNPDIVIHLAAIAFVGSSDANSFYQVNLIGTRNLLETLIESSYKPEAILLASSANIYGNLAEGILDENTRPSPVNDYAVSKLAMEYMTRLWEDKLPIIITRPFNYTGIGQTDNFLIPKVVSHFRNKSATIELGNIDVWRDFNDVRTLVKCYRLLIEKKAYGQTVNICSGKAYSLRDVVSYCEQITGHSIEIKINPKFVRANEVKTLCGDPTKLHSLIGTWHKPSLQATLQWMLEAE